MALCECLRMIRCDAQSCRRCAPQERASRNRSEQRVVRIYHASIPFLTPIRPICRADARWPALRAGHRYGACHAVRRGLEVHVFHVTCYTIHTRTCRSSARTPAVYHTVWSPQMSYLYCTAMLSIATLYAIDAQFARRGRGAGASARLCISCRAAVVRAAAASVGPIGWAVAGGAHCAAGLGWFEATRFDGLSAV